MIRVLTFGYDRSSQFVDFDWAVLHLRLGAHQATATGWARLSGCDCISVGWEDTLTTRLIQL